MNSSLSISPEHHVVRYISPSLVVGDYVDGNAFVLREKEESLSVNWLEAFKSDDTNFQLSEVRRLSTIISGLCWILKRVPYIGEPIRIWLAKFGGYLHCGDMRYLTNCPAGDYSKVKLLYHVSFSYRIKGFLVNQIRWKKFVKDHSISIYSEKLMIVAEDRTSRDRV